MKINKTYLPIILFSAIAVGIIIGGKLIYPSGNPISSGNSYKSKVNRLIDFIEHEYVDNVDTDSIVDLAVNEILERLDPHSVYISQNEFREVAESMKGNFVGIGVNFYMYKDTIAVIKPLTEGPSDKAGILSGDRILYADDYRLYGKQLSNDSLYGKLKGKVGSEVTLTIFRKSEKKKIKVKIKRDIIPLKSVDAALMLNSELGYIKINRFAETTYDEFKKGLKDLIKNGAKGIVVDVRDNSGGYLEKAVQIADDFLESGEVIVYTKNKKGRTDKTKATSKGLFEKGKVFVLINENSASASEILAGAIQDNDRGVIVGRRSFGKGLVQREMPLGDGSAVRLTVARYYTPSGRSIQKPYENGNADYYSEFERRYRNGELYEKDSIKVADSLIFKTTNGRTVYGGGGIVPDVFVPLSTNHGEEGLELLMQSGMVSYFVFEQLDSDRNRFKDMGIDDFIVKIKSNEKIYNDFIVYITHSGISLPLHKYKTLIQHRLAAEFVRQLYDDDKYYEILLQDDTMIRKVLSLKDIDLD